MFFHKLALYLAGTGKIGVWLFFVLSSFLLTHKLVKTNFNSQSLIAYSIGRFLRIFPLFIVSLIVYRYGGTAGIDSWNDITSSLLFMKAYSHLWTIPVEFKFYIWLPLVSYILVKVGNYGGIKLTLLVFIGMVAISQTIWPYQAASINTLTLGYYFTTFVTGSVLAIILINTKRTYSRSSCNLVNLTVLLITLLATPWARQIFFGAPLDFQLSNWFIYFGLLWSIFIYFNFRNEDAERSFLVNPFLKYLDIWSYPIYLFHWIIYMKLYERFPESPSAMILGVIASIIFGAIIHYLLERPIESFRKRLLQKL